MRDKHEFWTEVRVKENCSSFVIALSSQVKIEYRYFYPLFYLSLYRSRSSMPNERKKGTLRWVHTAVFLVILITLHNFSCSVWFKRQCMHDGSVLKYSVFNDRRPVKVFQSVFFTVLIFRFASTGQRISMQTNKRALSGCHYIYGQYNKWTADHGLRTG